MSIIHELQKLFTDSKPLWKQEMGTYNYCQCFSLVFRTKTLQSVCTYMAAVEPACFLSFLSTLSLTTAHIKVLPKNRSVRIHIWRALSIDDFMFIPVFLILRFWNAFVTFSIHIPALNWSHVENDFAFSNETSKIYVQLQQHFTAVALFFLICRKEQMEMNRSWHVSSCAVLLVCMFVHLSLHLYNSMILRSGLRLGLSWGDFPGFHISTIS